MNATTNDATTVANNLTLLSLTLAPRKPQAMLAVKKNANMPTIVLIVISAPPIKSSMIFWI
jgi:hypothetical protein